MTAGRVAARPFHFADCVLFGRDFEDGCTQALRKGQQWELGQIARGEYVLDELRAQTEFVGDRSEWTTWRRVARAGSTAAAVDPTGDTCRHFVPTGEWCPDCAPVDDVDELAPWEVEGHDVPLDVEYATKDVEVPLW